jgi:cytochrome P450
LRESTFAVHWNSFRPPAPKPHARRLGPVQLIATLRRNPLECWAQEHFEKLMVRGGLPFGQVVVVNQPDAIKRVLLDNADNYRKDTIQRRVLAAGLGDGLLSAEGEQWRVQRRTLAPLFARRTVMEFAPAMLSAAEALADRWRRLEGATIDVAAEMTRVTLDVLERTIFSDGFGRDAEDFRAAMATYFNTIGRIGALDLIGVPRFVPRASHFRVRSSLRFFDKAIDEMISTRSRRLTDDDRDVPTDILTLLLRALDPKTGQRMSVAEVRSNILTFISAGHETTANALTWTLFLLCQSPEWLARVEEEVERVGTAAADTLDRFVVTRAAIEEAIRLYPPIAAISRVAIDADELAGEIIGRGTMVVVAPYVLHRHRLLWNDPDAFDPSRFLPEARTKIDRFAYLPFGAGPRTCIGSTFALQEATLVLATIMKRFRLQLAPDHSVEPLLRVTLRPAGGLPMLIRCKQTGMRMPNRLGAAAS